MSWDFSSEDAIVNQLEGQQRTIFVFSKKIKDLEAKLSQSQAIYNSLIDGAARDTVKINELEDYKAMLNKQIDDLEAKLAEALNGTVLKRYNEEKEAALEKLAEAELQRDNLAKERDWQHEQFMKKLKVAVEALEFYAEANHWFYPGNDYHDFLIAKEDISKTVRIAKTGREMNTSCGGKRAREALAAIKDEEKK